MRELEKYINNKFRIFFRSNDFVILPTLKGGRIFGGKLGSTTKFLKILKMNRKLRKKLGIFRTNLIKNMEIIRF